MGRVMTSSHTLHPRVPSGMPAMVVGRITRQITGADPVTGHEANVVSHSR